LRWCRFQIKSLVVATGPQAASESRKHEKTKHERPRYNGLDGSGPRTGLPIAHGNFYGAIQSFAKTEFYRPALFFFFGLSSFVFS
jgi:hypothetical protein